MHISLKRSPLSPSTPIMLNGSPLESVNKISIIIGFIMVKSHPKYLQQGQIGLLYRKYYKFSDQTTKPPCFSYIYISSASASGIFCPCVGSPFTTSSRCSKEHKSLLVGLGCVQKLGMLAMKNCNILCSFPLFLTAGCFSSYALYYFKVIHGMCYFPPHVIFTRSTRTNFSRSFMLTQPELIHIFTHLFLTLSTNGIVYRNM